MDLQTLCLQNHTHAERERERDPTNTIKWEIKIGKSEYIQTKRLKNSILDAY